MTGLEYDKKNFRFKKREGGSLLARIGKVFSYLLVTLSMTVFFYFLVSFVFSTEQEKRLRKENKMYEQLYPQMLERAELIESVVEDLSLRDNAIYSDIFGSDSPSVDPYGNVEAEYVGDSIVNKHLMLENALRAGYVSQRADKVEKNFMEIFSLLADSSAVIPPMTVPLAKFSYAKTGASVGQKISPYYKVLSEHSGLDMMAAQGDEVLAAGKGVVTEVKRSARGSGNTVEIDHGNGYVTRYSHLADIYVRPGMTVYPGRKIATVGMTGSTFAPHLHFEIIRNGEPQDPVNYLFGDLSPQDYANVVYISSSTRQSMD